MFRHGFGRRVVLVGAVLAACLGARASADGLSYRLKDRAIVDGPDILAREVLQPAPKGALAKVVLGRVGMPGSMTLLTRPRVAFHLSQDSGEKVELKGEACRVYASKRPVKGAALVRYGHEYIAEQLRALSGRAQVEILDPPIPEDFQVPDRDFTFRLLSGPQREVWRGRVILPVQVTEVGDDGQPYVVGESTLSYLVKVAQPELVALKNIMRGDVIGPDNAAMLVKDTTYQQEDGFDDTTEAYGLVAQRLIPADSPVLVSQVQRPYLVKLGDIVRLRVQSGGVSVEVPAKAMRNGRKGDSIPVMIMETHKQVNARVVDSQTVKTEAY